MSSIELVACLGGCLMMAVPARFRVPFVAVGFIVMVASGAISGLGGALATGYIGGFLLVGVFNFFIGHTRSMIEKKEPEKNKQSNPLVFGEINKDGVLVFSNEDFLKKISKN